MQFKAWMESEGEKARQLFTHELLIEEFCTIKVMEMNLY